MMYYVSFYPEGDSINGHIPKDHYSLQYACVDDVITILRSLDPGSFIAKTDLNKEFSRDIQMWKEFLAEWNGQSFFLDSFVTSSPDLQLYADAASTIGSGSFFNGKWFQGRWLSHLLINRTKRASIE